MGENGFENLEVLIVGPCEEGFFRGFVLKKSENKLKNTSAILFSSLLFALYHVPPFLVPISTIITFLENRIDEPKESRKTHIQVWFLQVIKKQIFRYLPEPIKVIAFL
ncbi:MAG: CPBP family intramembrane metalloprotease [Candidatus Lokiarchaeota archaeon]|nr:CPBP family intramembrane metalloprotease [Candidatus Lokiarchaeota archaeon]